MLVLLFVVGLGCVSPTLPLPPPAQPAVTALGADRVHLSAPHGAEPGAIVVIVNQNTTLPRSQRASAALADGEGSWEADVTASHGDVLDITQEFGTARSPVTRLQVP